MKIAIALCTALVTLAGAATPAHASSLDRIVGVFTFQSQLASNCTSGEPVPNVPSWPTTTMFNAGGTLQGGGRVRLDRTPSLGVWSYDPGTSEYVIASSVDKYNPRNRKPDGFVQTEMRLKLSENGKDATGKSTFNVFGPDGKQVTTFCTTDIGVRSL